ncbi:methyltransferase domain-containing protein [Thalassolituus oleivorans]|uniref:methyltransferase domain-containing protein n=1 Tax=Thalassolituus oleivorans TaxID=187493 RepID=UPI00042DBF17|nr:methyltransferase domain-containing protein [Thalassolituus oleivorans]AHK16548.1 biotin biosynthesis protein BioC [Thalassolituus oleivorans R6-15]
MTVNKELWTQLHENPSTTSIDWCWLPGWSFAPTVFAELYQQLPGRHWGANIHSTTATFTEQAQTLAAQAPDNAIWIGWSLGGALAMAAATTSNARSIITLATGASFTQRPHQQGGMSATQFEDFSHQFNTAPAKTARRFLGLCSQGSTDAKATLRALAEHQLPAEEAFDELTHSLAWLGDYQLDTQNAKSPQQHWYGNDDALNPHGLIPSQPSCSSGHAFFLRAEGRDELLATLKPFVQNTQTTRNKQLVAQQFSRAARSYDDAASIQQRTVSRLLEQIGEISGHWLDIGCGTGAALPSLLALGAEHISGIDLASGMLEQAAERKGLLPNQVTLLQADADDLPIDSNSQDGVFSSLMLQWSEDPNCTLQEWSRVLKPNGLLAIATLIPGTQRELRQAWLAIDNQPHVNHFTDTNTLKLALQNNGLTLLHEAQSCLQEDYASLPELLRGLKAIGATNVNPGRRVGLGGRAALTQLDKHYPRNADGTLPLSYEVIWLIARAGA